MERLTELLSVEVDLDSLSQENLEARRAELREAVKEAHAGEKTAATVELIKNGVAAVKAAETVLTARAEETARIIRESDEALAAMGDDDETEVEAEEVETGEEAETEIVETEAAPVEATETTTVFEAETEAVPLAAAAKPAPKAMVKNVTVPAQSRPRVSNRNGAITRAAGNLRGTHEGKVFGNEDEVNAALHDQWMAQRSSPDGVPHVVATIDWRDRYPAAQRISGGDAAEVSDQLMGYIQDRNRELMDRRDAFVASGGVPGPAEARYDISVYGQSDRPLKEGLPNVLMTRGATTLNTAPVLSAIVLDTALGAVGTVTSAADLAGATKDIQEIPAPVPATFTVEAETMRFSQGQFAEKFLPEWFRGFQKLGLAAYARHNEALRLADLKAGCTKYTDTLAHFGAYRDLKRQFFGQLENLSDLIRDYKQPIRVVLPEFVAAQCATDLIAQAPGDQAWKITKDAIKLDVATWDQRVNVTWVKDSIRGPLSVVPSGQSPRTAGFDADVEWAMFPEGAFAYGDGGFLDLGVLRDSATVATNKMQTFYEQWEALLQLVPKSVCFWMTSSLCASGTSQAAATVAGTCEPQGS